MCCGKCYSSSCLFVELFVLKWTVRPPVRAFWFCLLLWQIAVTWNAQKRVISATLKSTQTTARRLLIASVSTTNLVAGSRRWPAVPAFPRHRTAGSATHGITRWRLAEHTCPAPPAPRHRRSSVPSTDRTAPRRSPTTWRTTTKHSRRAAATAAPRNHRSQPDPRTSATIPRSSRTSYITAWPRRSDRHMMSSFSTDRGHSPAAENATELLKLLTVYGVLYSSRSEAL